MPATQSAVINRHGNNMLPAQGEPQNPFVSHYHVVSVDKAQAPGGADGDWFRYVLAGGRSPITGLRRGTLREVTEHAHRCASELNQRNSGKAPSAWAPRRTRQS
jgi:hypothetical protein